MGDKIQLWTPKEEAVGLRGVSDPADLASYAKQLAPREIRQIIQGFEAGHYEMAVSFVWSKAMTSLKQRLSALGAEFVGELLDRPDLRDADNLVHSISDLEALRLAEELGMFNSTQGMRLRNAMVLVQHFTNPPDDADPDEGLDKEEAISCLKASVQGILGHERLDVAVEFAEFRALLEEQILTADSEQVAALVASPYFFRRTTLRVLLGLVKHGDGIALENALGNLAVILPLLWEDFLKSDRWDVGRSYAEVHSAGKRVAASGIGRVLMKVRGFDYVPENLRSLSFIGAANAVLEAHYGYSNFHSEPRPMKALSDMGSIPSPALSRCVTATLCVALGNSYGRSWAAQPYATTVLESLSVDRWLYYLQDCLPADDDILDKLQESKPQKNWIELVQEHELNKLAVTNSSVAQLLNASVANNGSQVGSLAKTVKARARAGR